MKLKHQLIPTLIVALISLNLHADIIDDELRQLIDTLSLTGNPTQNLNLPAPNDPEAELGKLLFFSQALGGEKNVACASCHHPYLAGGDGLALAVGVDAQNPRILGNGRKHPNDVLNNPRNTPSIFNSWVWTQGLFWDSRVEMLPNGGIDTPDTPFGQADLNAGESLLIAQAGFPVTSIEEMRTENFETEQPNHVVREHLGHRLANTGIGENELAKNEWRSLFEEVYGDQTRDEDVVNFQNVKRAIASYENSLNLSNNRWFDYIRGDKNALKENEKRGAKLFFSNAPSGAGCATCHSGDTFTNQAFFNIGFPQIGPGKGDGESGLEDHGRGAHTGDPRQNGAFRTPTLLNVAVTAPYGHSGAYQSLEQVIEHYNNFDINMPSFVANKTWCNQPQFSQIENCQNLFPEAENIANKALASIQSLRNIGIPAMLPLNLSEQDKSDLIAFLHTLTDPCTQNAECMSKWLPQADQVDPDNLRLHALNERGIPLAMTRECKETTLDSGALQLDQMECISGGHKSFYVYVKEDNSTLYISTTGGSGNVDLFYHSQQWASPRNAQARSISIDNEELIEVQANRGYHYITLGSKTQYALTGLTVSVTHKMEDKEAPPKFSNSCALGQTPLQYAELQTNNSICVATGTTYFYHYVDHDTKSITVSTDHGTGDISLYSGHTWVNSHNAEYRSTNVDSNIERIHLKNPPIGWLYITIDGSSANGVSLKLEKQTR